MPDITMCDNKKCPKFKNCYRAQAVPHPEWQSWATFNYNNGCDYFLKIEPGMKTITK